MAINNIFVNLPVKDLEKTQKFFLDIGFTFNPQFTDETAACLVLGQDLSAMLLSHAKFKEFTPNEICDATQSSETIIALSCDSREEVDTIVQKAIAAGGKQYAAAKDFGFMYQHGFQDLDGHIWEIFYMDPAGPQS